MPAFMFEKIPPEKIENRSSPVRLVPASEKKPRGVIFQALDRLVELHLKRTLHRDNGIISRRERMPPD